MKHRPLILTQTKRKTLSSFPNLEIYTNPNEPGTVYVTDHHVLVELSEALTFLHTEWGLPLNPEEIWEIAVRVLEAHYGCDVRVLHPDVKNERAKEWLEQMEIKYGLKEQTD